MRPFQSPPRQSPPTPTSTGLFSNSHSDGICRACSVKSKAVDHSKKLVQEAEQQTTVLESVAHQLDLRTTLLDLRSHATANDFPDTSTSFLRNMISTLYPDEDERLLGVSSALIFDHPRTNHGGRNAVVYANRPAVAILLSILYQWACLDRLGNPRHFELSNLLDLIFQDPLLSALLQEGVDEANPTEFQVGQAIKKKLEYFLRHGPTNSKVYTFKLSNGEKVKVNMAEVVKRCRKAASDVEAEDEEAAVNMLRERGEGEVDESDSDKVGVRSGRGGGNLEFNSEGGGRDWDEYSPADPRLEEREETRRASQKEKGKKRKKKNKGATPTTTTSTTTTTTARTSTSTAGTKRSREEEGEGGQGKGKESGEVVKLSKKQRKKARKKAKQQALERENEEIHRGGPRCIGWAPCMGPDCTQFYDCTVCGCTCCLECRHAYGGEEKLTKCQECWVEEARGDDKEVMRRKAVIFKVGQEDM
ncbi:hypothetical protein TrCOL_g9842 [Triparma columacea]|uniref:Uncharacterized protein n=1 Tax=Triparma columacea TaxID=722753 RepID=A0A9W7FW32_9STRA|nr:hypothetical protein TrCOL_g9842 [Triparma columacea]